MPNLNDKIAEEVEELKNLFREYRAKYPDANFDDAIGLIAGSDFATRISQATAEELMNEAIRIQREETGGNVAFESKLRNKFNI